jgi:hypothetical protein
LSIHIAQSLANDALEESSDALDEIIQELEQMSDDDINNLLKNGNHW